MGEWINTSNNIFSNVVLNNDSGFLVEDVVNKIVGSASSTLVEQLDNKFNTLLDFDSLANRPYIGTQNYKTSLNKNSTIYQFSAGNNITFEENSTTNTYMIHAETGTGGGGYYFNSSYFNNSTNPSTTSVTDITINNSQLLDTITAGTNIMIQESITASGKKHYSISYAGQEAASGNNCIYGIDNTIPSTTNFILAVGNQINIADVGTSNSTVGASLLGSNIAIKDTGGNSGYIFGVGKDLVFSAKENSSQTENPYLWFATIFGTNCKILGANKAFCTGADSIIKGDGGASFGYNNEVDGVCGFTTGRRCLTQGCYAFSTGLATIANGQGAVAYGVGNMMTSLSSDSDFVYDIENGYGSYGDYSITGGYLCYTGPRAYGAGALGGAVKVYSSYSFGLGADITIGEPNDSNINGVTSFAMGQNHTILGNMSMTGGTHNYIGTGHHQTLLFGTGLNSTNSNQLIIGTYNNLSIHNSYFAIGNGSSTARSTIFNINEDDITYKNSSLIRPNKKYLVQGTTNYNGLENNLIVYSSSASISTDNIVIRPFLSSATIGDTCSFMFTTSSVSATYYALSYDQSNYPIYWTGDDISDNKVSLQSNKAYTLCLWYDGIRTHGVSRGVVVE